MSRIYALKSGKKGWVSVGWFCFEHKFLELEKKKFQPMGHGAPGSVLCPDCGSPMKALYSQIKGKNQLKRVKGLHACFSTSHEPCTMPKMMTEEELVVAKLFSEVLWDHGREIALAAMEEIHGKDYADGLREMFGMRTIHDRMIYSARQDNWAFRRRKIAHPDGTIGDFITWPGFEKNLLKHKDTDWSTVMGMVGLMGINPSEDEQYKNREAYINTSLLVWYVKNGIERIAPATLPAEKKYLELNHIMKDAYTLYGFLFALQCYRDNLDETLESERRVTSGILFHILATNSFDMRALNPEQFLYTRFGMSKKRNVNFGK
jgi:hypothetical protein